MRSRLFPLHLYRVSGQSMQPTFQPGDLVVGWSWYKPKAHDVAVIQFDRPRIKRIRQILPDGHVWVVGDNPDSSSDSRDLGSLPPERVMAKVLFRL